MPEEISIGLKLLYDTRYKKLDMNIGFKYEGIKNAIIGAELDDRF